ncbi:hypothetical protein VTN00DRAFT_1143 [Thermoascus crustaceus]|uniref:uncharacterized protein n=1 Tax=Thermoascus crustaceus TaxID=5088 RepID=UPI0037427BD0
MAVRKDSAFIYCTNKPHLSPVGCRVWVLGTARRLLLMESKDPLRGLLLGWYISQAQMYSDRTINQA